MEIIIHEKEGIKIAQIENGAVLIAKEQDALDLMVEPRLEGSRRIILRRENFAPEFFDLSTRLAGGILQKFVTYQMKLAIVGDFADASKTLKDFIYESNRGNQIFFVSDIEVAKTKLFFAI